MDIVSQKIRSRMMAGIRNKTRSRRYLFANIFIPLVSAIVYTSELAKHDQILSSPDGKHVSSFMAVTGTGMRDASSQAPPKPTQLSG